jgi:hypothetical protein
VINDRIAEVLQQQRRPVPYWGRRVIPTFGRSDSVLKAGAGVIHF